MAKRYQVISADSHVNPLPTFWKDYLPERYRDQAPRLEETDTGDFVLFEGKRTPFNMLGSLAGKRREDYKLTGKVAEIRPGGWDPGERIKDLNLDKVDAEVLFGGGPLGTNDPDLHIASYRAYNTWLADFCAGSPDEFLGMAYIPMGDAEHAVQELEHAAKIGLRGIVLPAYPPSSGGHTEGSAIISGGGPEAERSYADPEFEPFWRAAVEHDLTINVHLGARRADLRPHRFLPAMVGSKLALGEVISVFIFGGILQRHPQLRFVSVESGVGWFAFCAQYMDHIWERHRFWTKSDLAEPPSYYMNRQVYGTFLDDTVGVQTRDFPGATNIMWSSDYPHSETTWPNSLQSIEEHFAGVPDDARHAMVCGTASRLFHLA